MYESWLALNILFELARTHWPWLAGITLIWALLMFVRISRRGTGVPRLRGTAAVIWIVASVASMLALPMLTRSSLADVAYIVDWLNLVGIGMAIGAVITAFAWPLLGLMRRSGRADGPVERTLARPAGRERTA